ncbi:unnamed protein product [Mucor fragilis]
MEISVNNPSIKNWLRRVMHTEKNTKAPDVFGVPLYQSLQVAQTMIAYEDKDFIIGTIPIIVAKCGAYLKDQGLYVEGVFRKSGSAKRVGELQQHFNSSSDFGIGLNWRRLGYTVHDAANCLRRFLNYLPEPVILFSLYEPFRNIAAQQSHVDVDQIDGPTTALMIQHYQALIEQLPPVNQYLLFYLLDLLALFSRYAKYTKMNSMSLASVFTPGILLNPEHAMNPTQYKLSQRVVQFLIEHQEHFHLSRNHQQQQKDSHAKLSASSHINTLASASSSFPQKQPQPSIGRANTVPVHGKNRLLNDDLVLQIIK